MLSSNVISVRVTDSERRPLARASVRLVDPTGKHEPMPLTYDKQSGLFRAPIQERGTFLLVVDARGLEGQKRPVRLPAAATPIEFILGRRGLPSYHRGQTKTPFEPKLDLLALTLRSDGEETEAALRRLARKLGLSEEKVGEQIRANNVRIFRHPSDRSAAERQAVLEAILKEDMVALAGPVVELFDERAVYLTNQLIVKFTPNVTRERAETIAGQSGLSLVRSIRYAGNAYLLEGEAKADYSLLEAADALTKREDVEYAEPNAVITSIDYAINPGDFLVSQQWHIPLISLPDAWQVLRDANAPGVSPGDPGDLTYGDENLLIAVFDRGIESSTVGGVTTAANADFQGNVTGGAAKVAAFYDFRGMVPNNDAPPSSHGMGCAGVVGALADNASTVAGEIEGVAGAAGNCRVVGIIAPSGTANLRWADAFVWMAGLDPGWVDDGVTYPVGTVFPAPLVPGISIHTNSVRIPDVGLMDDTLDFLATYGRGGKGVVSFLAAGNTAAAISHPSNNTIADHDKVMTIAASINTDVRSGYSCFDPAIDICAPSNGDGVQLAAGAPEKVTCHLVGSGNLVGHTGGSLDYRDDFGGTSSATPLAAGVAALMLSINPDLTWIQVRELMRNTAVEIDAANIDPIGQWTTDLMGNPVFSQWYGYGRVDAEAAVIAARDLTAAADIAIRDNLLDSGAVPSGGWHANSPDIWVRRTDDPIPALAYTDAPPHQNPFRGQDNYVYLRVKNVGTAASNEVYLRALITHYPGFEFRYPEEWIPSVPPSSAPPAPLIPGTYLIGEEMIDDLAVGDDIIVKMVWDESLVPPDSVMVAGIPVTWHPCLLAEVSPHDGPEPAGATFDVRRYNDLAQKNITVEDPGFSADFVATGVVAGTSDPLGIDAVILDRGLLAPDARVFIVAEHPQIMEAWVDLARKGRLIAGDDLPWRPAPSPDLKPSLYSDVESGCVVTLLKSSRLLVECCGESGLIIDAPKRTKLQTVCLGTARRRPSVSIGRIRGKEVIYFEGGSDALQLPMRLAGGQFVPLAIGIDRHDRNAGGAVRATQRRTDGTFSPGYEIRL